MSDYNVNESVLKAVDSDSLSDIVNSLSTALYYEFEGERSADAIEEFIGDYLRKQLELKAALATQ